MIKYKIVKLPDGNDDTEGTWFYGAEVGDVMKVKFDHQGAWAYGSPIFKEDGWQNFKLYCIANDKESLSKFVEEVV